MQLTLPNRLLVRCLSYPGFRVHALVFAERYQELAVGVIEHVDLSKMESKHPRSFSISISTRR